MRVTVVQLSDLVPDQEWAGLVDHVSAAGSDLVVLGEMPFGPWLPATDKVDLAAWAEATAQHDSRIERFAGLAGAIVAGSRPVVREGTPYNAGFVWSPRSGLHDAHLKHYLPDEPGFWEATWYRRSPRGEFASVSVDGVRVGFMICTDMWFTEHARGYARQGADLLVVPRATEARTAGRWLAGGRVAAVMAGAFCVSSNRQGLADGILFGGGGWIIDPDGDALGVTSNQEPFVTVDIDLAAARRAKRTYPRYVAE